MKGVAARKLAVDVLVKVEVDKAYANLALNSAFERGNPLPERDRAFTTALVQGVLRHRDELDAEIAKLSSQPIAKLTPVVKNLLRVAIFQLRHMQDIPASAVLNTATEIGKKAGHAGIGKFVTGVLRTYLRKMEASPELKSTAVLDSDNAPELATKFSMPEWLVERWLQSRGREETIALLEYSQSVPPLVVRAAETGITPEGLLRVFESNGIKAAPGKLVDSCLIIEDRGRFKGPIEKLPGFTDGLFVVQDEAAAFASKVVAPAEGDIVVDLCAAPGGKSIHLAELMDGKGKVIAVDNHEGRLEMVKKNRLRIGLTNIQTVFADGTNYVPTDTISSVLLDAPCSGTGVINRRSDLRFKREQPDIAVLVQLQRQLLSNAAKMIKDDGILVYSTCSIEPEENEENLKWFLEAHPNFKLESLAPYASKQCNFKDQLEQGFVQLLPTQHGVSGFFVARMKKTAVLAVD